MKIYAEISFRRDRLALGFELAKGRYGIIRRRSFYCGGKHYTIGIGLLFWLLAIVIERKE
jgi:hypothetical protein